jgi:hypothetical protein
MKGSSIFVLMAFLSIVIVACDTSSNVDTLYKSYFIKTFGGDGDQEGVDILVNSDNTITLLGNTTKPSGEHKIYFVKTDFSGKILIEKELGFNNERAMDIEPLSNGYVILSNVFVSTDRYDIKLLRTDLSGELVDSVVINGLGDQYGSSVTSVSDGRFFVVGNTRDTDASLNADLVDIEDQEDLLIVELDNTLSVLNTSRIGKSSKGKGIKIFENATNFTYAGYSDEIVVNADTNTNFIFRTFITDPNSAANLYVGAVGSNAAQEKMSSFVKMPDGTFYGIGTEISSAGLQVYIASVYNVKDNTTPTAVPRNNFSHPIPRTGTLEGVSGYPSLNGGSIFILANEYDEAEETRNLRLLKMDVFGKEVWSQQFGSAGNDDVGNALAQLPNGDVVILGTANLINQHKLLLIKVNNNGTFR